VNLEKLSAAREYLLELQQGLSESLEEQESSQRSFFRDEWDRPEAETTAKGIQGRGISMVLEGGEVLEKAGVNFSLVQGSSLPPSASASRPQLAGRPFHATGVSIVIHPRNPYAPTSHANVRFFLAPSQNDKEEAIWWFGGGFDLTPYYGFEEDAIAWHQAAKAACDPFGESLYPKFKRACDQYFFLPHRDEPRGIGGIFFDDFDHGGFDQAFAFLKSVGNAFGQAYLPILEARKTLPYGERERAFQQYRRGRYVEFNLVYDRGTVFGLQSQGRAESILMSLPPLVSWKYNYSPEANTPEADLYEIFLKPTDWADRTSSTASTPTAHPR